MKHQQFNGCNAVCLCVFVRRRYVQLQYQHYRQQCQNRMISTPKAHGHSLNGNRTAHSDIDRDIERKNILCCRAFPLRHSVDEMPEKKISHELDVIYTVICIGRTSLTTRTVISHLLSIFMRFPSACDAVHCRLRSEFNLAVWHLLRLPPIKRSSRARCVYIKNG